MDITSIIKSGALVLCLLLVGCDKAQISNDAGDHIGVSITAPDIVVLGDVVNLTASLTPHGDLDIDESQVTYVWEDESSIVVGLASSANTAHFIAPANLETASIKVTATYQHLNASDSVQINLIDPNIDSAMIQNLRISGPTEVQEAHNVILNAVFTENGVVDTTASFTWESSDPSVTLTPEQNGGISFTAPDVLTDTELTFTAQVTDIDGTLYDETWIVVVKPAGIALINQVNTGTEQVAFNSQSPHMVKQVNPGDTVTLTTQAQSTGGGTLEYKWEQTSGATVNITDSTSQTTDFVAPALPGDLTFKVTATDPTSGKSTTQIQKTSVKAPAIMALTGPDHIVYNNHGPVKLNARVSGGTGPYTYVWTQTAGPGASITSTTDASPSVTLPSVLVETTFVWQVVITDADGLKATTTHSIKVPALPAAPLLPPVAPLSVSINGASAPIVVTEGDTVHPTVSIAGGTGTYAVSWTTANVTINNPTTTTPDFILPDITNTQGHDETLHLTVVVSDGSVDAQGKAVKVSATAGFTIKPAFIVSLHQNQQGSSGATSPSVATNQKIHVASQKNLHPVVDIAENAVSSGTYTYQWTIVKPNPAPSDLSIAGADQLHPILAMPMVTADTPLELSLVTTYTASSGKVYKANRTLNYIIEPPAAPSKQSLSLSTGGHISVLSGHVVRPTVSVLNASGNLNYKWDQISGPDITSTLTGDTTKAPTFTAPNVSGHKDVVLEVTVSDGTATETAQVTYSIDPFFIPALIPISVTATNDSTVVANATVSPTATVLHSNGAPTYSWAVLPSGEPVTLTGATTATPSFVAPNAAGKQVELEVTVTRSDGSQASDTVIYTLQGAIEITAGNATQSIGEGGVLDLLASTKNAAGAVTYAWTVLDANGLTPLSITDANKSQASITMPAVTADTVIKIQVEANDTVNTVKAVITVTVKNFTLQVDAGSGYGVPPGHDAYLHGSVTGGLAPYTYAWVAIAATPANPTLTGASSANPSLTAPTAAQSTGMQYELTVTDSLGNLAKSTVTLTVIAPTFSVNAGADIPLIENAWGNVLAKAENNVGTLTWAWTQVSGPTLQNITSANTSNPWFQAPGATPGTFVEVVLEVTATDASSGKTVKDQVKVLVQSVPDVFAKADATLIVKAGEVATLVGEATGAGTVTELKWRPDSSNTHSVGSLFNSTISDGSRKLTSTFNAPVVSKETALYFNFSAVGTGNIDNKRLKVLIVINPNTVKTGPNRSAVVGQTVQLSAVAPVGATFSWVQLSGPSATLLNTNTATPTFIAEQKHLVGPGHLSKPITFEVTATGTPPTKDTVEITVNEPTVEVIVPDRWIFQQGDISKNPIVARLTYVDKSSRALITNINDVTFTVTPNSATANFSLSANFDRLNIDPTGLVAGEYEIDLSATALASTPLHDEKDGKAKVFVSVSVPPTPAFSIDLSTNPPMKSIAFTGQAISLHAPTITRGTPPFKYDWSLGSTPQGITVTGADTGNPIVTLPDLAACTLIEGDITLTVIDSVGKSTTGTIHYKSTKEPLPAQPISCHTCRGPKFICERSHVSSVCQDPSQQYCINDIENLSDGSRYVTRRCATAEEVNDEWFTFHRAKGSGFIDTAGNAIDLTTKGKLMRGDRVASNYNVVVLVDAHFSMSLPCKGNDCNLETVPDHLLGVKNEMGVVVADLSVTGVPPTPKAGVCP